jgi:hypothetical protein
VLGSRRVGKSSFIQKALDLRQNPPTTGSSKKMALDGVVYVVRLLEVLIDDITIDESKKITWPKLFDEENGPTIDGALILYDVTNGESVIEVPNVLCESGSIHAFLLPKAAPILILQPHVQCLAASHHRC